MLGGRSGWRCDGWKEWNGSMEECRVEGMDGGVLDGKDGWRSDGGMNGWSSVGWKRWMGEG